jgi:hypothetical protein
MPTTNGLKVCTFNAKCDHADYKCCIKDACHRNNDLDTTKIPDSLIAALIAITILPSKADIYNIQNVENKCVVEHLLKEIARVKDIMDEVDTTCNSCDDLSCEYLLNVAAKLNSFSGLCDDAVTLKEALECCDICGLDYDDKLTTCEDQPFYSSGTGRGGGPGNRGIRNATGRGSGSRASRASRGSRKGPGSTGPDIMSEVLKYKGVVIKVTFLNHQTSTNSCIAMYRHFFQPI